MNRWLPVDDERLRDACARGLSSPEIATLLGRSRQAVNYRVHKLGVARPRWRRDDPAARFWPKVDKTATCWLWTASVFENGYGLFHLDDRNLKAHRYAYELLVGPIPDGLEVRHTCDVARCVNPEHLSLGTHAENMADMVERDRAARGKRNGRYRHGRRIAA